MHDTDVLDSGSSVDLICDADWPSDMHLRDVPMVIGANWTALKAVESFRAVVDETL